MKLLIIESDLRMSRSIVSRLRNERMELDVQLTADARGAFGIFQHMRPDVVLLDMAVGGRKGLELCRRMVEWSERSSVIMLGSQHTDACPALDAGAIDFLLRPLEYPRLVAALDKAQRQADGLAHERSRVAEGPLDSYVASRLQGGVKIIPVRDVRLFRAEDKYVTAVHARGQDLIDETLSMLEERFGTDAFIRVHRNGLVARRAIRALKCVGRHDHRVQLNDGEELKVSRRHLPCIRRMLLERSSGRLQAERR